MQRRILLLAALLGLAASPARAHGGGVHVKGTVSAIDAGHLIVKAADGTESDVRITAQTRFLRGGAAVEQKDLQPGERVVVHARKRSGALEATEIRSAVRKK